MFKIPVAVFGFNRPELIERLLEHLAKVQPKVLYFFCDGPRNQNDLENVKKTQKIFRTKLSWSPKVEIVEHKENQGLARSLSGGISKVFEIEKKLVIFEDDIVPDPSFFRFCEENLERYEGRNIAQITGHCPLVNRKVKTDLSQHSESYYFSRYCMVWGWATWKESWRAFNFEPEKVREGLKSPHFIDFFEDPKTRSRWITDVEKLCIENNRSLWALRWNVANWALGRLSIIPTRNLCSHQDTSSLSTHVHTFDHRNSVPCERMSFPLMHPECIKRNVKLDALAEKIHFHLNFSERVENIIRRNLIKYGFIGRSG